MGAGGGNGQRVLSRFGCSAPPFHGREAAHLSSGEETFGMVGNWPRRVCLVELHR